ncbi:MAG: O-antigen ligase domain-containing protein [Acidimicrobiia bacterium]
MSALLAPRASRSDVATDRRHDRTVGVIWGLLLFNGLAFTTLHPVFVSIPPPVGKGLTQGALALAFVLALLVNRGHVVKLNVFLALTTLLVGFSLISSIRLGNGPGTMVREVRFAVFVAVLWLLTPWWGRRDLLLARWHLCCLLAVEATVALGFLISPGGAYSDQRLHGYLYPIPPPQVAHYAAIAAGMAIVLWLAHQIRGSLAAVVAGGSVFLIVLSHTRTATLGLVVGVAVATVSLFLVLRRARRTFVIALVVIGLAAIPFAPAIESWFTRGQTSEEIAQLTGRTKVWNRVIEAPRSELDRWFGAGLSNKAFDGLPIDNSWLAVYMDQGLIGDALVAGPLLFLLLLAAFRPRGGATALALFIIVYCMIASYTESGLGDVSPYLLDLTVAASLLTLEKAPAPAQAPANLLPARATGGQ